MTFGVCGSIDEGEAILGAGFDTIEVAASGFRGHEERWDPAPYRGLPIVSTNLFFDGGIRLFGPDRTEYLEYARRTIERAATLGVRTMVVGSGNARRAPEGFDGLAAFVAITAELQAIATPLGITIAPESLNADETNVGVRLGDLAPALDRAGVGFTADSYHLLREWRRLPDPGPIDALWTTEGLTRLPAHVHIAPLDRGAPHADDPHLRSFAAHLISLGYDGHVSLEATRDPAFDLPAANLALRVLFQPA